MNFWLKQCYNDIKDQYWPEIESYYDFTQLPNRIKQECINDHGFIERVEQLENMDHWRNRCFRGIYKKNNLVFIAMYKCASSSYISYLKKQKWEEIEFEQINFDTMHVFGFILDPMNRRLKGLTEILSRSYNKQYDDIVELLKQDNFCTFLNYITMVDAHTIPYWILFGEHLTKINWIPLECYTHNETFTLFQQICKQNSIQLDNKFEPVVKNVSDKNKKQIFDLIKDCLKNQSFGDLYLLYANDLKFYRKLVDKHIKQEQR